MYVCTVGMRANASFSKFSNFSFIYVNIYIYVYVHRYVCILVLAQQIKPNSPTFTDTTKTFKADIMGQCRILQGFLLSFLKVLSGQPKSLNKEFIQALLDMLCYPFSHNLLVFSEPPQRGRIFVIKILLIFTRGILRLIVLLGNL